MNATLNALGEGHYALAGEVTADTVPTLWPRIAEVAVKGGVMDVSCARVGRADSAAVACLVEWARLARAAGGSLLVHDLPAAMEVIMEVSDLDGILSGHAPAT